MMLTQNDWLKADKLSGTRRVEVYRIAMTKAVTAVPVF
jgi:hypothetical protein